MNSLFKGKATKAIRTPKIWTTVVASCFPLFYVDFSQFYLYGQIGHKDTKGAKSEKKFQMDKFELPDPI
jgi:hypothetical protein